MEWAQFDPQSIVDAAINQWRSRLSACVHVGYAGHTSSINSDHFETDCYLHLEFCEKKSYFSLLCANII